MANNSYSKHTEKPPVTKKGGCLGTIVFFIFWIGFVGVLLSDVIPDDKQSGVAFDIALLLFLLLPLWIKPLCRLIAKQLKSSSKEKTFPQQPTVIIKPVSNPGAILPENKIPVTDVPALHGSHAEESSDVECAPAESQVTGCEEADPPTSYADVLLDKSAKVQAELLTIDLMEGHQFEEWCAEALKASGFSEVSVTPGSGDQGVDVLAEKDGIKYAFQCKRYNSDLGNTPIQEVHSGKDFYHRHVGVVITNQYFTDSAIELASVTGTLLWSREWITGYLERKYSAEQDNLQQPILIQREVEDKPDEMFYAAVDVILETGQASVSMIQRRLKLGYARAAKLIDEIEEQGIVGPFQGSKPRAILITQEQWQDMRNSAKTR